MVNLRGSAKYYWSVVQAILVDRLPLLENMYLLIGQTGPMGSSFMTVALNRIYRVLANLLFVLPQADTES